MNMQEWEQNSLYGTRHVKIKSHNLNPIIHMGRINKAL